MYSQLSPCGHPTITGTPLLRTGAKSPAETTKKCMEIIPTITDSRYYGIADTSCGLKQTFLLVYSRYNGHSRDNGHLTLLYRYLYSEAKKIHFTYMLQLYVRKVLKFLVCILSCIVSYRIVSYRIVSYRYRIVSYRIVSYRIVSYRIVSLSYRIVLYCIV